MIVMKFIAAIAVAAMAACTALAKGAVDKGTSSCSIDGRQWSYYYWEYEYDPYYHPYYDQYALILGVSPSDGNIAIPSQIDHFPVTGIEKDAFKDCIDMTSMTIPDGVTYIANNACSGCSGLTNVTIGTNVKSIGDNAFSGCSGLTSITIPAGATSIGDGAFSGCSNLKAIYFEGNAPSVSSNSLPTDAVLYVRNGADGWDVDASGKWHGCEVFVIGKAFGGGTEEPGDGAIDEGGLSKFDVSVMYDGWGHAVDSSALAAAFGAAMNGWCTVSYALDDGSGADGAAGAPASPWTAVPPSFKNAGEHIVWYRVENPVYANFIHAVKVRIGRRKIALTSADASKIYDGTSLVKHEVSVGGDGFASGEGATYAFTGSQTYVGESANLFKHTLNENTKATNYDITSEYGTLKVAINVGGTSGIAHDGLTWYCTVNEDGALTLDRVSPADECVLDIPATLGGIAVTSIGDGAFTCSSDLTSVTIPNSVTSIGDNAFYWCGQLASVMIPDSVTSIGAYAFSCCSGLTSVTIGANVKSIGDNAFSGCSGLTSVTANGRTWRCAMNEDGTLTMSGVSPAYGSLDIPATLCGVAVTSIGDNAFSGCSGLTSITIPAGVTGIGDGAFSGCSNLKAIYFGGNAPIVSSSSLPIDAFLYVREGASGWDVDASGKWSGCEVHILGVPAVRDLKVTPVAPWGMVIDYTVGGVTNAEANVPVAVTATADGTNYVARHLSGATNWTNGTHRVYWNMAKDGITATVADSEVTVAVPSDSYCVVDLSGGADATNYPVSYLAGVPAGGWTNEHKTTKLVLRRIEAGTFIIGDDQTDESHRVTLTKPFYVGVFEVTQRQWELVMGSNPSQHKGNTRPVERVSYDDIRGSSAVSGWPLSSAVDATSFLGKLRAKTGLDGFDLPTEAQWEYACRAGTTSKYNNGGDAEDDLKTLGRYSRNRSDGRGGYTDAHTTVGSYAPNAYGLYDMHGNVHEWCLDWYNDSQSCGIDPKGSSSGSSRVDRGGNWDCYADSCASSLRDYNRPSAYGHCVGLRLACQFHDGSDLVDICAVVSNVAWRAHGESDPVTGPLQFDCVPDGSGRAVVSVDGHAVVDSATSGTYTWLPQPNGTHTVVHSGWDGAFTAEYVVPLTVSNVEACQRWPWNGLVDIDYTITGGEEDAALAVRVTDGDTGRTYVATNFLGGVTPPTVAGRHRITWDTAADGLDLISSNVTMEVSLVASSAIAKFPVDTRAGKGAILLDGTTTLRYSSLWDGDADATVTLAQDGVPLAEGLTGEGTLNWNMPGDGTYTLTHTTYTNGVKGAALTATFCTWRHTVNSDGTATLTEVMSAKGDVVIPEEIDGRRVTALAASLFEGCTGLTSVTLPSRVTAIGASAFAGCTGLTSVTLPSRVTAIGASAFAGCTGLTSVTIPSRVTTIGAGAFSGCTGLTSVTLPSRVTALAASLFSGCTGLETVTLRGAVTSIGERAFSGCARLTAFELPDSLESIGDFAFEGCNGLSSVRIPEGVAHIGMSAFARCGNVQSVVLETIPPGLEAPSPFLPGPELVSGSNWIEEEDSLDVATVWRSDSIGDGESTELAFDVPAGMESFVFAWKVGSEEKYDKLTWYLDDAKQADISGDQDWRTVTNVLDGAAHRVKFVYSKDSSVSTAPDCGWVSVRGDTGGGLRGLFPDSCANLTNVVLGADVTELPSGLFAGCAGLDAVALPSAVTVLPDGLFAGCAGIRDFAMPLHIERIGASAFRGCSALAAVDIPAGVSTIGASAFAGCTGLAAVRFAGDAPSDVGEDAFPPSAALYVRHGSAGWDVMIPGTWHGCPIRYADGYCGFDLQVEGWFGIYDGEPHGVSVTVAGGVADVSVKYALSANGPFVSSARTLTDAGAATVWCEISAPGYDTQTCSAEIAIARRVVTLTSGSASKEYDGTALVKHEVSVGGDGFVPGEGATYVFTGSQTAVGASDNAFTCELENTKAANYDITVSYGTLTVTDRTWTHSVNSDGTVTLTGVSSAKGDVTLPGEVGGCLVSAIGDSLFAGCTGLVSVTIPSRVTSIGASAFAGCTGLVSVTIPSRVTSIGEGAFSGCTGLRSVAFPSRMTAVGARAFRGCTALKSVELPSSVARIEAKAFEGCTGLEAVSIPAGVASIAADAFSGCAAVRSVAVPARAHILSATFPDAWRTVTNVAVAAGTTAIDSFAFSGCTGLVSVSIPAGVKSIGSDAFSGCARLVSAEIPSGVAEIGEFAFSSCASLVGVALPSGLSEVAPSVFQDCASLTSVTIPAGVEAIGDYAFAGCTSLGSVGMPPSLVSLGESAFEGCPSLASVAMPSGVDEIGDYAFYGCAGLEEVVFAGNAPADVGDWAFPSSATVYVPYSSTGWGVSIPGTWQGLQIRYAPSLPTVEGDAGATVTGDAEAGYTVTPNATNRNVEVTIPAGVSATNVTVEVGTGVETVKPNGANVRVKSLGHDITSFLDIPAAVGGVVNLAAATVKADIVKEALDSSKGAEIDLSSPSSPSLTTAPTRKGLVYTLREGATLDAMRPGATKVGDGSPWTPTITVKGGASGFYTIRVDK